MPKREFTTSLNPRKSPRGHHVQEQTFQDRTLAAVTRAHFKAVLDELEDRTSGADPFYPFDEWIEEQRRDEEWRQHCADQSAMDWLRSILSPGGVQ